MLQPILEFYFIFFSKIVIKFACLQTLEVTCTYAWKNNTEMWAVFCSLDNLPLSRQGNTDLTFIPTG